MPPFLTAPIHCPDYGWARLSARTDRSATFSLTRYLHRADRVGSTVPGSHIGKVGDVASPIHISITYYPGRA